MFNLDFNLSFFYICNKHIYINKPPHCATKGSDPLLHDNSHSDCQTTQLNTKQLSNSTQMTRAAN